MGRGYGGSEPWRAGGGELGRAGEGAGRARGRGIRGAEPFGSALEAFAKGGGRAADRMLETNARETPTREKLGCCRLMALSTRRAVDKSHHNLHRPANRDSDVSSCVPPFSLPRRHAGSL